MPQCIRIHPADNVAVALCPIPAGTRLSLEGRAVQMREDIPQGQDLTLVPGFEQAAAENLRRIRTEGARAAFAACLARPAV